MHFKTFADMFVLSLPIAEKILRPVVVYVFLVVGLRLAGKRELAQLNPFDLIVLLTLSNTVQNAIIGEDNSVTGGLIGATTLLAVNYLVVRFLFRHGEIDRLIEGDATVLIENCCVLDDKLQKELLTRHELEAAAHRQGFSGLDDVERCVLEPGGTLSFVAKKPEPDETRHKELLRRLEEMMREIEKLRTTSAPPAQA
jgi:uncharacterized membrane protein YcaP (DUF421 family)